MFFDYIDAKLFIISFAIGMFYTYVKGDDMKKIYIYPTPENYKNFIIEDNAGQCFQYKPKEVSCKGETISKIPIQK
jgi:hypothetical protein